MNTVAKGSFNDRVTFQANYSINEYGLRNGCLTNTPSNDAALFFGCSFTFGEGVEDKETLPCQFQTLNPKFKAYNFGFMGYGPQQTYLRLKDSSWSAGINNANATLIYTYIDRHVQRLIGSYSVYGWFGERIPIVARTLGTSYFFRQLSLR
jgi:hypothetical protein